MGDSKSKKDAAPEKDPYDVLGIPLESTDNEISKAYRKLALQLHPDKQLGLSQAELDKVAARFHDIQQARAFLLDPEFSSARNKYKNKQISIRARKAADAEREKAQSETRKRMKEELMQQEREASTLTGNKLDSKLDSRKRQSADSKRMEELRRQGKEMQEQYSERASKELSRKLEAERRFKRDHLEERQIRLKWSRKKMGVSPDEHAIASRLKQFGDIQQVEFIGSKGNAAIVTFASRESCKPCVYAFKNSEEMRASYVGKRKEQEEDAAYADDDSALDIRLQASTSRDTENVSDWKLRRASERERLIREMENDEHAADRPEKKKRKRPKTGRATLFPAPFPPGDESHSALHKLEKAENMLLKGIASDEVLQAMQVIGQR